MKYSALSETKAVQKLWMSAGFCRDIFLKSQITSFGIIPKYKHNTEYNIDRMVYKR
ncbi:hypothetical protein CLOM621_06536 [Clostridium sp. M62/1]|nr:hypothetical protein CLOM621_06536 [Clostridium sp. M62/1]